MHFLKSVAVAAALASTLSLSAFAQEAAFDPNGTFVDEYGTTFTFALCGAGTDLCGTLDVLKGESATEENLAFVGTQVMQAQQTEPNVWKGTIDAGGLSADATVTQTSADTIDIEGCRAGLLCQTLTYTRQ
ncbi:hypothetical protein ASD83_14685 [Devosia sp. Root685]|uniref:hypothetical protein n=1 Tax=Devosia sp. Root685 TaxID=1736587 RepID=UPI0006FE652C|nr:hypothetical protein [Devosia sp. Root685]KRA98274.1 hypothetical protein ASD83_14685 [Devosia sp. Root685]